MAKYIDADALKEAIVKMMPHDKCGEEMPEEMAATDMAVSVIQKIDEMPAADVEPVRHGGWKYIDYGDGDYWAECQECGEQYKVKNGDFDLFDECYHYCPACGAKMDGGSE
ncbi:MAG: hypothetical protein LUG61_08915 [Lachnospiraceae bacterium]|nr:hypothetical protein [Lachnospiraceae bacterium]